MPSVIGLDIGTSAFRAVEISSKNKGKTYILECALTCENCVVQDPQKLSQNLKHFIDDSGFSTKNIILGLPESNVFSTILNVPFQTDKEVKNYLELQGGKIFPKPLSELVYSFVILGPNEANKAEVDVNVVACSKDYVSKLFEITRDAGLNILAVESEAYAVVRALLKHQKMLPNDALLVVNVGSLETDMMVIRNDFVRFSRNISLGGSTFGKAIAQSLNISEEQAEEYKKSYGIENNALEGKIVNAVRPVAETLMSGIKRTINFYASRNSYCEFKKVIYSGGSAVMPGLLSYSAENLGMEVELANPFVDMEYSSKTAKIKDSLVNSGPLYTVSVGLALKEGY